MRSTRRSKGVKLRKSVVDPSTKSKGGGNGPSRMSGGPGGLLSAIRGGKSKLRKSQAVEKKKSDDGLLGAIRGVKLKKTASTKPDIDQLRASKPTAQPGAKKGLGKAKRGSLTEMRALKAAAWIDAEIDKLIAVIERVGTKSGEGEGGVTVTFGELFAAYQDISDTLVGILMRAKKRGRLVYEGDMLFRGTHDDTLITVLG